MNLEPTSDANDDDALNDELDDADEGQLSAVRFDQLTATDFEEFCFDLLAEVGFINVDRRKGTPKHSEARSARPSQPAAQPSDEQSPIPVVQIDGVLNGELHSTLNAAARIARAGRVPDGPFPTGSTTRPIGVGRETRCSRLASACQR